MEKYLNILVDDDFKTFENIEKIRTEIISQNRTIKVIDYGAGNPEDNRTEDEMRDGVPKKISTKELCKIGLKSDFAHLIYALVKQTKPATILELGTCCGFSSIYMSKALHDNNSLIHTIEGSPETAKIAQENFKKANSSNIISHVGKFSDTLPKLLEEITPINFAFIDGHHDKDATLEYFKMIKPYLDKNALVLFDDISWSSGMKEVWKIIKQDTDIIKYEDFSKLGLCFMQGSIK